MEVGTASLLKEAVSLLKLYPPRYPTSRSQSHEDNSWPFPEYVFYCFISDLGRGMRTPDTLLGITAEQARQSGGLNGRVYLHSTTRTQDNS